MTLVKKRNVTCSVVTSDSEINPKILLFGGFLLFDYRHSARRRGLGGGGGALDVVELSMLGPNCSLVAWLFVCLLFFICIFC